MSTPSYKGPGQPIRSAQGGIADFLGGLFGGTEPSYKTPSAPTVTPPQAPPTVPSPAPMPTQAPMPVPLPLCPTCPLIAACPVQASDAGAAADDGGVAVGQAPITIVIQSRS